jgi:FAD/FMN-containing dehydrogenase
VATSTSTRSGPTRTTRRPDEAVLRLAVECGGTISAEHGVGVAKARRPDLVCSEGELALMRPRARDRPGGILNPGVVLPAAGQD